MRLFFIAIILPLFLFSCRERTAYELWQDEAETNWRLQVHYGNIAKTKAMKEADDKFIRASLAEDTTARKASNKMVWFGFRYIQNDDYKTAMYRFNQAWLLDSLNERVYLGYASVYWHFMDYKKAIEMYDEGLKLNSNNASLLTDKANLYLLMLQSNYNEKMHVQVFALLNKADSIRPNNAKTLHLLSVVHLYNNDCANARHYYDLCQKYGGYEGTQEFANAIATKCK